MLQGFAPLSQQREAAPAQAPLRAQQRVAAAGISLQLPAADRPPDRDIDSAARALVPRIGQHRQHGQERPQHAQELSARRGQVC